MQNLCRLCAVLICVLGLGNSARILAIFHVDFYSHYLMGDRILKELAMRGHEITVITPFEQKVPFRNLRHIVLTYDEEIRAAKVNLFDRAYKNVIAAGKDLADVGLSFTAAVLNDTNVQELLNSDERFDLVIYDKFLNEAFSGFAYHYKVPCIITSGIRPSRWSSLQMGNPHNPAYVADVFSGFSANMNFFQRTYNFLSYVVCELFDHFWRFPKQNELLQKYFPGAPDVLTLYYNTSLMFVNSHVSVDPAVPLVPNMIDIGGYHIRPSEFLPKHLQKFLDDAEEGVVFFSMGSNLKSTKMSVQIREELINAFGKLKERVLWKWEDDVLPDQPANIKLEKWLPQQDILAHTNVKLFITHGGLLGLMEAIYHGVPILGIPVCGDQYINVKNAEDEGYGLGIPYTALNSKSLSFALNELLNNTKYTTNAKKKSRIMHDQPIKPLDKAIYWIEYIIRHEGAPHLRTAALNLAWYQYLLLDVVATVVVVIVTAVWVLCKILRRCQKTAWTVYKNIKTN